MSQKSAFRAWYIFFIYCKKNLFVSYYFEFIMSLKDFEILAKLGDGSYSTVYKVKRMEDGQVYALKRVKMSTLSSKEKDNALNEIRILASIRHPNVIAYKQAFVEDSTKSLWYFRIELRQYRDGICKQRRFICKNIETYPARHPSPRDYHLEHLHPTCKGT